MDIYLHINRGDPSHDEVHHQTKNSNQQQHNLRLIVYVEYKYAIKQNILNEMVTPT